MTLPLAPPYANLICQDKSNVFYYRWLLNFVVIKSTCLFVRKQIHMFIFCFSKFGHLSRKRPKYPHLKDIDKEADGWVYTIETKLICLLINFGERSKSHQLTFAGKMKKKKKNNKFNSAKKCVYCCEDGWHITN